MMQDVHVKIKYRIAMEKAAFNRKTTLLMSKSDLNLKKKLVKCEKGDLVAESQGILAGWRNHFSQLLNVRGDYDVRQSEIHSRITSA